MGLRFRKSFNLGGGFRVNLSKSGIGYSWGTKGLRVTQTAKGKTRRTSSIAGTGISHVSENGKGKKTSHSAPTPRNQGKHIVNQTNLYDTQEIKNADAGKIVSEGLEDMLEIASNALRLRKISMICFLISLVIGGAYPLFLILAVISLIVFFTIKTKGVIDLTYTFQDEQAALAAERIAPLHKISKSKKIWYLTQTSKAVDKKYSAGANNLVKREKCRVGTTVPFPFKTNANVVTFTLKSEKLVFLPDKLFIIQGTKIGALNYSDVDISFSDCRFIEEEGVPSDAKVVGHTWKYVNKSGGPDNRFSDNKQLPICLYGGLTVKSNSGLNTAIVFSNINLK